MFVYNSADVTYAVTWGKVDGSSNIDYSVDLNKKEARIYTKARMLGQDLADVMDAYTYRIEREIIRYERDEYGSDIRDAKVSIWFCDNQEQPPIEDVKAYLRDLLKAHKYDLVHEVVEAQIIVFKDTENDWEQIALDLANEVNCPGYAKWKKKPAKQDKKKSKVEIRPFYFHTSWRSDLFNTELSEEEKIRRYRGCKNITKLDGIHLHIITKSGKEVVIKAVPPFELKFYGVGLCPFNTSEWFVRGRKDGYIEGEWGFFDTEGKIVIEPKYRYACGPYGSIDDEYYIVAECYYDKRAWGILDAKGNEVLPCSPIKYTELMPTKYGAKFFDVLIFAYFSEKPDDKCNLLGLMKRDGTVIMEPRFSYISNINFNWDNKLFLAGLSDSHFGVFSLEKDEFITPDTCSYVEFNDKAKLIKCRYPQQYVASEENYYEAIFDYDGNLIDRIVVHDYHL